MDDLALLQKVQELIAYILSEASFAGQPELVTQVPYLRIGEGPITFIKLLIDRSVAPRSAFEQGPVPGSAWVFAADGSPIGTMLVWVNDVVDWAVLERDQFRTDTPVILTTWHSRESLAEVIEFFAKTAIPAGEYRSECRAWLLVEDGEFGFASGSRQMLLDYIEQEPR